MNNKEEFLIKLKALLKEYNADIYFTCDDASDCYGLIDPAIEITLNNEVVLSASNLTIDEFSIDEFSIK